MSIKGFIINGDSVKYNHPDLDNIPNFSLGIDETDGLAYVYVNGVKQGDGIDVGGGGGGTKYNITKTLSHATSSNTATKISEGQTYTSTLTANQGYEITSVAVTMGGVEVSGAYNPLTGAISVSNVSGDIAISNTSELVPIDLLNVTWANHAITCGQDTNNYNAWSPHNLQYDSENDCFVFLQCHANRHINQTYTNWTLSIINPYDSTDYEDITIPTFNGLGMLFVENGVWTLLPRNSSVAYQSDDMGETWESVSATIPQYIFGVYKCGDTYFAGNDSNSAITYYKSDDLLSWTEVSFDSSLGYSILCETTFCEFDGKYWAFNRTNDSTLGHPVILQSSDEGSTWTLFSDQMLHGYRSTVSCYPFQNYIMVADVDRDNGVLYYNKFDGSVFTQLNTWQMPKGGDDFHNVNITSNYQDTVILEFMHTAPIYYSGSTTYSTDRYCDNVMLVGSTKTLPSVSFGDYIDSRSDMYSYASGNLTSGLNGGSFSWDNPSGGSIRVSGSNSITSFTDEIELPLNMIQLVKSDWRVDSAFKNGNKLVYPWNNANGTGYTTDINTLSISSYIGIVTINGVRYMYGYNGQTNELPVLIRAEYLTNLTQYTPSSTQNNITGETWQEALGFRRVISINKLNNGSYVQPFANALFNAITLHGVAFMSYTTVEEEST